jgi:RimJ/RimL family protein N-acetyltransferase
MWRHELWTGFTFVKNTLLIEKEYEKGRYCFMCPLGDDFEEAVKELETYCLTKKIPLRFYAVCEDNAARLIGRYPHYQIETRRDWADYLYNLSDLRDFPGKRYDSKRHNVHQFYSKRPNAVFKEATAEDTERLEAFLNKYLEENKDRDISLTEMSLTKEMLLDPSAIGSKIGYFEENGQVIGLSLGEKQGDTIYQHIEKALREYNGIYQALTSAYLTKFGEDAAFVNREEDDGNPGLREAKLQLHPVEVLRKRFYEVTNQFDLYHGLPTLKGKRLSARPIEEADKEAYFALATDEERNRYWGYDYKNDVPAGVVPDADYFYNDVKKDYESRECFSLMLHDEKNNFLGELVLYHFGYLNSAEVGVRLTKEAEGQGYAQEAAELGIDFLKELGLAKVTYESYLANEKSLSLATRLGFKKTAEGDNKRYFVLPLKE